MSWNFQFQAKDKATALAVLDKTGAPAVVKEFIAQAINGLSDELAGYGFGDVVSSGKIVFVKSDGHLVDGPGSYEVSTNTTEVKWLYLSELKPAPAVA